jgi:hypothetical protein
MGRNKVYCVTCSLGAVGALSVLILVGGIGISFIISSQLSQGINKQTFITDTSSMRYVFLLPDFIPYTSSFDQWQNNTTPESRMSDYIFLSFNSVASLFIKYWLFNITNPDEIEQGGLPNVTEVG